MIHKENDPPTSLQGQDFHATHLEAVRNINEYPTSILNTCGPTGKQHQPINLTGVGKGADQAAERAAQYYSAQPLKLQKSL